MSKPVSTPVFVEVHEFWWPVTVEMPADGGGRTTRELEARLKLLTDDELLGRGSEADEDSLGYERRMLAQAVTDWRGEGLPPFSAEALAQAIAYSPWRRAFARALIDSHHGGAARAKN